MFSIALVIMIAPIVPVSTLAEEQRPEIMTVDLSKLPPGVAKKVRKAAVDIRLPPGLAKKPADHPGRIAHLKKAHK